MNKKQTDAAQIEKKDENPTILPETTPVVKKKRQLRKKQPDRWSCREALVMQMLQKAMEALEAMDVTTLSATNIVHLLEIAAKLEKISGEKGSEAMTEIPQESVKIYLPDNQRT